MRESNPITVGGVGFTGLLTIVFIVLKLTGVISWSWWWVLSPAWIGIALTVFFTLVAIILMVIEEGM